MGIIGGMRPQGTNLIIEDVCFPPAQLAKATHDLLDLLAKQRISTGSRGACRLRNLHFVMIEDMSEDASRQRYDGFMCDLVAMVVESNHGFFKTEHGTGINMAPFVRREWGDTITDLMWRINSPLHSATESRLQMSC